MITKEQSQALRKAGLAGVCEVLGFGYKWADGRDLSPDELSRVQAICEGRDLPPFTGEKRVAAPSKKATFGGKPPRKK